MSLSKIVHHYRTRAIIAETTLAMALFLFDPLGLAALKGRTIDNWFEASTQYSYRTKAADRIGVVLIDEDSLKSWRVDWPVTYEKTAEIVHALACARVIGVFLDFTASKQFNLNIGEKLLEETIDDSSRTGPDCIDGSRPNKIKVFFGKAEAIHTPLADWLDRANAAFWLEANPDDGLYAVGGDTFPEHPLALNETTPAFGIMRSLPDFAATGQSDSDGLCHADDSRPRCWINPIALVWNGTIDPDQGKVSEIGACRGRIGLFQMLLNLFGFVSDGRYETCPPILTLKGQDLSRDRTFIAQNGDPARALAGRFVFVGTQLSGLNDHVYSPVHGYLPGVYEHAVAFDNLITYGANYPTVPRPRMLIPIVLAIFGLIEVVKELTGQSTKARWFIGGTALVCVGAVVAMIYFWKWPVSLIFAIFGYYGSSLLFLEAAGRSPPDKVREHIP
jgi:CHASE2 domain-containing sensor protein